MAVFQIEPGFGKRAVVVSLIFFCSGSPKLICSIWYVIPSTTVLAAIAVLLLPGTPSPPFRLGPC